MGEDQARSILCKACNASLAGGGGVAMHHESKKHQQCLKNFYKNVFSHSALAE